MIALTKAAVEALGKSFIDNVKKPIRINHTETTCCGGSKFDLGIGEPTSADITVEENGFTFVINKDLAEKAKSFYIDADANGWLFVESQCRVPAGSCCR